MCKGRIEMNPAFPMLQGCCFDESVPIPMMETLADAGDSAL